MGSHEIFQKIKEAVQEEQARIWKAQGLDLLWPFGSHQENAHSAVIAYLLVNPDNFKKFLSAVKLESIDFKKISVDIEYRTNMDRRIDIFIKCDDDTCIIIENKIYARDQYAQLYDYYNYAKDLLKFKNIYTFYLTLDGKQPSKASLNNLPMDEVQCISYETHILPWIYSIYKSLEYTNSCNELNESENSFYEEFFNPDHSQNNVLKSALEQYMVAIGDLLDIRCIKNKTQQRIIDIIKASSKEDIYTLVEMCSKPQNDIPSELLRMKNILKCYDVYHNFGGVFLASQDDISECNKEVSMETFTEKTPYFTGVLMKEKNISIIFLDDDNDQYQIGRIENDRWAFAYQGYGLDYKHQFKVLLKQ